MRSATIIRKAISDIRPTREARPDYFRLVNLFDRMSDDKVEEWAMKISADKVKAEVIISLLSAGEESSKSASPVIHDAYSDTVINSVLTMLEEAK